MNFFEGIPNPSPTPDLRRDALRRGQEVERSIDSATKKRCNTPQFRRHVSSLIQRNPFPVTCDASTLVKMPSNAASEFHGLIGIRGTGKITRVQACGA
jgi:hypothetical protein